MRRHFTTFEIEDFDQLRTVQFTKTTEFPVAMLTSELYLSKSMGIASSNVRYYYILVPCLADIMFNFTNESFNEIIPEVDYEDEQAK